MKYILNKLRHFYWNKYVFSIFLAKKYYMSYDYEHKALWFRTYKVASRTIDDYLRENSKKGNYIYGSQMAYLPWMFKNYFKFCFIRNPESRFVSAWKDKVLRNNYFGFSSTEHEKMKDIDNFISWVETLDIDNCDEHLKSQNSLIDLNNIDFIGRFENFNQDFIYVLDRIGIESEELKHLNEGIKSTTTLTEEQRRRIQKVYEKDYRIFYPNDQLALS